MDTVITAFVAKSFASGDQVKTQIIEDLLAGFKPQGFIYVTAEPAESEFISQKVRALIEKSSVFVGVFTRRHPLYTSPTGWRSRLNASMGKYPVHRWACPPWLLQESGYALALGKRLILFREVGVDLPALQGDLEYINFDPLNPTSALQNANHMINSLIAELRGISVTTTVDAVQSPPVLSSVETTKADPSAEDFPAEEPSITGDSIKDGLLDAAAKKDWVQFNALLPKLQEQDPKSALFWQAHSLYLQFQAGNTEALENLKNLYELNPSHVGVAHYTSRAFMTFDQYDEALRYLQRSTDLAVDISDRRALVTTAVEIMRDAKRFTAAKDRLLSLFAESPDHATAETLALFSAVLRDYGDVYSAIAVGEFALKKDPGKATLRHRIGLDYHTSKQSNLFLWQFTLYCQNRTDGAGLHNLALAYSQCDLPIHSVRNYKKAYELGEVLSASNLAYKYLDAGMADEAKGIVNNALKTYPESGSIVGRALAEISEREDEENKKEESALDDSTETREFLVTFGEALVAKPIADLNGMWTFRFGDIELRKEGNSIVGKAEIQHKEGRTLAAMMNVARGTPLTRYSFNGEITGRTCEFRLDEQAVGSGESSMPETILGGLSSTKRRQGRIVFHETLKSARIMEIEDDKWKKPYAIERITDVM